MLLAIQVASTKMFIRSKVLKALFLTFDLMKNLLVTSTIMRIKGFMHWRLIIRATGATLLILIQSNQV
jgi:hypothetical protein